jgi:hypothetical protein
VESLSRAWTFDTVNGFGWNQLLPGLSDQKLAYTMGLRDAMALWESTAPESPDAKRFSAPNLNHGEVVEQLDQFYADAANGSIPICMALAYVHAKLVGATPAQLAELTAVLRRAAVATAQSKPASTLSARPPLPQRATSF